MSHLVLANVSVLPGHEQGVHDYVYEVSDTLVGQHGFYSVTLWRSVSDPSSHLLVYHYKSSADGDVNLAILTERGLILSQQGHLMFSPVVQFMEVRHAGGMSPGRAELGSLITHQTRFANPGMEEAEMEDLDQVLLGFQQVEGYEGHAVGHSKGNLNEIITIAYWQDMATYLNVSPDDPSHEVKLYTRVI